MLRKSTKSRYTRKSLLGLALGALAVTAWLFYRMKPSERRKKIRTLEETIIHGARHVHDFFIPHERNSYKPHVFRHRAVRHVLIVTLLVKVAIVSLLFAVYPNPAFFSINVKEDMYRAINEYRASRGLEPLQVNSYLEQVAQSKGTDMLEHNYFSHFGVDGKKPWQWIDKKQYDYSAMGENLAMDFLTAPAVLRAFQQSPTHDKNLLHTAYGDVGIAVLSGTLEDHETNVMVVYFGSQRQKPVVQVARAQEPVVQTSAAAPVVPSQQPAVTAPPKLNLSSNTNVNGAPLTIPVRAQAADTAPALQSGTDGTPVAEETDQSADESSAVSEREQSEERTADESEDDFTSRLAVRQSGEAHPSSILGVVNTDPESAEPSLFFGSLSEQKPAVFKGGIIQRLNVWSDRFYAVLIVALLLIFLVNVIVKIHIQHASVVAHALILILVQLALFAVQLHRADAIGEKIRILAFTLL